jgi:carboxyl-terminal processing protease
LLQQKLKAVQKYARTRSWLKSVVQGGVLAAALVVMFVIGVNVGSGRISVARIQTRNEPSQNASLPSSLDYRSVDALYDIIKERYDGKLTESQLLDGIKSGLAEATGDPYTQYFSAKEAQQFNEQISGSFSGVGAQLGQDKDKNIEVIAPIEGSPAQKAGLLPKDIIAEVDGKSTSGWSVDEAVSKIRGPKGTKVTLDLIRNKSEQVTLTITRDEITVPSVTHKILDGTIGYLQINQFSNDTADLAHRAASEFRTKQVKGIVLDLRSNPGGLVDSAVDVASLWLPANKTVLQEKRGPTVIKTYYAEGGEVLANIPTVVLIDGGSASASEIVAGALKDNRAASLVGEKSYGKGSVQEVNCHQSIRLGNGMCNGAEIKITVARWYRPNGQNIDKKGIVPDETVKLSPEEAKAGTDAQLQAALQRLQR